MNQKIFSLSAIKEHPIYGRLFLTMPEEEKVRLQALSFQDQEKAFQTWVNAWIQKRALELLKAQGLPLLEEEKRRQAVMRHAYYYVLDTQSNQDRLIFPQWEETAKKDQEVVLSLCLRTDLSLEHMQEAMAKAFIFRLEVMKVEILEVQKSKEDLIVDCFYKDWGQTKLQLSLNPMNTDPLQSFSAMGRLKEKQIQSLLQDQKMQWNRASSALVNPVNIQENQPEASNLKKKVAMLSGGLILPDVLRESQGDALVDHQLTMQMIRDGQENQEKQEAHKKIAFVHAAQELEAFELQERLKQASAQKKKESNQKTAQKMVSVSVPSPKRGRSSVLTSASRSLSKNALPWVLGSGATVGVGAFGSLATYFSLFT